MQGKVNQQKRVKGSKHDDLTAPSGVIEFKLRSKRLESLPGRSKRTPRSSRKNRQKKFILLI